MTKITMLCLIFTLFIIITEAICQPDSMKCYPPCPIGTKCVSGLRCDPINSLNTNKSKFQEINPYEKQNDKIFIGTLFTSGGFAIITASAISASQSPGGSKIGEKAFIVGGAIMMVIGIPTLINAIIIQSKYNEWNRKYNQYIEGKLKAKPL
jgi:hypothetical protein